MYILRKHSAAILLAVMLIAGGCSSTGSIPRAGVSSSAMRSVGYDEGRRILAIEFPQGDVYHYFDVPPDIYAGLMAAESHGHYFHEQVRGKFRYERLNNSGG